MHAYGRTLRRVGDLYLLALPGDAGRERYCVAEGPDPIVTYPTLEQALGAFEAIREATDAEVHRRQFAAGGVTDLCIRFVGDDQRAQLERFTTDVLPALRG